MSCWLHMPNTDPVHHTNVWYVQFVLEKVMSLLICLQKVITAQPSIALIVGLLLHLHHVQKRKAKCTNKVFNIEVLKTNSPTIKVQDLDSRILIFSKHETNSWKRQTGIPGLQNPSKNKLSFSRMWWSMSWVDKGQKRHS